MIISHSNIGDADQQAGDLDEGIFDLKAWQLKEYGAVKEDESAEEMIDGRPAK